MLSNVYVCGTGSNSSSYMPSEHNIPSVSAHVYFLHFVNESSITNNKDEPEVVLVSR